MSDDQSGSILPQQIDFCLAVSGECSATEQWRIAWVPSILDKDVVLVTANGARIIKLNPRFVEAVRRLRSFVYRSFRTRDKHHHEEKKWAD